MTQRRGKGGGGRTLRLDEGDLGGGNYFGSHGSLLHAAERATEPSPLPATEPAVATTATMQAAYGQLPLSFEANQGQSDAQVQFLALRQPSGPAETAKRGIGESEIRILFLRFTVSLMNFFLSIRFRVP